jgi:hypothetical protein
MLSAERCQNRRDQQWALVSRHYRGWAERDSHIGPAACDIGVGAMRVKAVDTDGPSVCRPNIEPRLRADKGGAVREVHGIAASQSHLCWKTGDVRVIKSPIDRPRDVGPPDHTVPRYLCEQLGAQTGFPTLHTLIAENKTAGVRKSSRNTARITEVAAQIETDAKSAFCEFRPRFHRHPRRRNSGNRVEQYEHMAESGIDVVAVAPVAAADGVGGEKLAIVAEFVGTPEDEIGIIVAVECRTLEAICIAVDRTDGCPKVRFRESLILPNSPVPQILFACDDLSQVHWYEFGDLQAP